MTKAQGNNNTDFADLLPWYVNGTLDSATMVAIDRALETDPELQRNLDAALEDQAAALELADADPVPASITARFEAQLDQEIETSQKAALAIPASRSSGFFEGVGAWIQETLLGGSRPRLAFAAAAAVIIILLQSGAIISMIGSDSGQGSGIDLASDGKAGDFSGTGFLVQIAPDAKIADLSVFLETHKGAVLEGPLPGGMYRLGFANVEGRAAGELEGLLKEQTGLFTLILPGN